MLYGRRLDLSPKTIFVAGVILLKPMMLVQLPFSQGRALFSLHHSGPDDTFMDSITAFTTDALNVRM